MERWGMWICSARSEFAQSQDCTVHSQNPEITHHTMKIWTSFMGTHNTAPIRKHIISPSGSPQSSPSPSDEIQSVKRLSSGVFTLSPTLSVWAGEETSVPVTDKSLLIEINSV